jgi:hypothetical protein
MKAAKVVTAVKMPAGTYWVGDPCYAVPDNRWMEWLEAADYMNERRFLLAELDGHAVLGVGTAWGDGVYRGSDGNFYPVDAGLIGVVPVEVASAGVREDLMKKVTFDRDFECSYDDEDGEGVIVLGDIRIKTKDDDDVSEYLGSDGDDEDDEGDY